MILTDREIEAALSHKQISITPSPKPEAFSSTSVDLTLLNKIRIWKKEAMAGIEICPANQGYNYAQIFGELAAAHEIGANGQVIGPGDFVLAWTAEQVTLPITARLAARVEGKSSLARLGIGVHVTAPTIHVVSVVRSSLKSAIMVRSESNSPLACLSVNSFLSRRWGYPKKVTRANS